MLNISNVSNSNGTESLEQLNARYAEALVPLTITFGFFAVVGIAGNLLVLFVFIFGREFKRDNFKIFVVTLCLIDVITCMTLIPAEMIKHRHYFDFSDVVSCKVKCFFNVFSASASCFALFVISIERFRKVVQPMRKQISPKFIVFILIVVAFLLPIAFAVPGTIMCGIYKTNKTNVYGGQTEVYLCAASDKYRHSVMQTSYKYVLFILLVVMSLTYIVLYTFVMRVAIKQLRAIAAQRKKSSFAFTQSSEYSKKSEDQNSYRQSSKTLEHDESEEEENPSFQSDCNTVRLTDIKRSKMDTQFSLRSFKSIRSHLSQVRRTHFPTKTIVWFILTVIFVITYMFYNIIAMNFGNYSLSPGRFAIRAFLYRFYFINHIVNPVVYAIFVKRFRNSCKALFPTIKKRLFDYR